MRKTFLAALAAATIFSIGTPAVASIICGGNGCNAVQTKQVKHRKYMPMQYTKPIPKAS